MPVTINGTSGITTPAGTVSGPLVISQNNSTGIPAINLPLDESTIQGPATNTAIRMGSNLVLRASGQASIDTNNVARVIADSSGRVTMPAQPAFRVARPTDTSVPAGFYQTFVFNTKTGQNGCFDTANNFNTATGTFTAPVAGRYLFTISYIMNNQTGRVGAGFFVSGVEQGSFMYQVGNDTGVTCTIIIQMAANDTCVARISNVTAGTISVNGDSRFTYFSGYLLG